MMNPGRRKVCLALLYFATAAVGTVLWITLVLIRHIRSTVPLSVPPLALSICAGNLLAFWTLLWV
jgi:hypothetical protein